MFVKTAFPPQVESRNLPVSRGGALKSIHWSRGPIQRRREDRHTPRGLHEIASMQRCHLLRVGIAEAQLLNSALATGMHLLKESGDGVLTSTDVRKLPRSRRQQHEGVEHLSI